MIASIIFSSSNKYQVAFSAVLFVIYCEVIDFSVWCSLRTVTNMYKATYTAKKNLKKNIYSIRIHLEIGSL